MALALLASDAMNTFSVIAVLLVTVPLSGCAALPVLPAAVSAGSNIVKAGTAHVGGTTYRTFSVPLSPLQQATLKTLDSLGFAPPEEETTDDRVTLRARAVDRNVRIDLQPITPEMTQMKVVVRKEMLSQDLATASELVAQTELMLAPQLEQRAAQRKANGRRAGTR